MAATWTESNERLFVGQSADTACKSAASIADIMYKMHAASMFRTVLIFHPKVGQFFPASGWVGERFPDDPGTDTWGHKELAGVEVYTLTATELSAILAKNGNAFLRTAGLARTYASRDGGARTSGGEWIDKVRGIDALKVDMQLATFSALANASKKIPFTNLGVSVIVGVVETSLGRFTSTPDEGRLLTDDPKPRVVAPKVKNVSAANKDIRNLPGVKWYAQLAGAIHAVEIEGSVVQ